MDNELGHTLGVLANLCKTRASLAFVTDFGLFEWVRMPFGLKCASNSFIRALQLLLLPLRDFCDFYVDDIATFTSGRTEDRQDS